MFRSRIYIWISPAIAPAELVFGQDVSLELRTSKYKNILLSNISYKDGLECTRL